MKDTMPRAIVNAPTAIAPPPCSETGKSEKSELSKADGGSEGMSAPAVIRKSPPISMIIPPMILRIAMIVTPVGRDFGVGCMP
jgi:hypothetical protein